MSKVSPAEGIYPCLVRVRQKFTNAVKYENIVASNGHLDTEGNCMRNSHNSEFCHASSAVALGYSFSKPNSVITHSASLKNIMLEEFQLLSDNELILMNLEKFMIHYFDQKLEADVVFMNSTPAVSMKAKACFPLKLKKILNVPQFANSVRTIFNPLEDWRLVENEENNRNSETMLNFLSCFAIFEIISPDCKENEHSCVNLFQNLLKQTCNVYQGQRISIVATPFASSSPVLYNSLSCGIVSNLSADGSCILFDARCMPGCEGGALFACETKSSFQLIGIVVSPFCWKSVDWTGFSIACGFHHILAAFFQNTEVHLNLTNPLSKLPPGRTLNFPCVFRVQHAGSWGSGVALNSTLILTCGHILKFCNSAKPIISYLTPDGTRHNFATEVVYCAREDDTFDVALLKRCAGNDHLQGSYFKSLEHAEPSEGQLVHSVGFGLFSAQTSLQPSISQANICKVIKYRSHPVIIQTSCTVNAGDSGGAIINAEGHLLGILQCNTRCNQMPENTNVQSLFPHINIAIPYSTIHAAIMKGKEAINDCQRKFSGAKHLWKLEANILCKL